MDTKLFLGPNDNLIGIYLSQLGVGTPNRPSPAFFSFLLTSGSL